ncbi:PDZ and LIM domain protein 5 isoform X2 [Dromaius novaehollandiae]|uniref:PDZ and LIM domain protein 5 isoform X2 n=1 Tax=Dromaius novaehollandiae TaxID=8790 RepID=UPI00311E900F
MGFPNDRCRGLQEQKLNDSGKAARAHVGIGDVVLTIDGISTDGMTHLEAQNKIKACTGNLNMTLQRVATVPKPDPVPVQKGEPKEVVKPVPIASPAAPKAASPATVAYNKTPRPFGAAASSKVTSIPSPSSAFTPSPAPPAPAAPAPRAAPGLHVNANAEPPAPAPGAARAAANVPRQPAAWAGDPAPEVAEGPRRGLRDTQGDSKLPNGPPRKHIVDTYTEFYHTPTHSDASKKRLIEDTEDWHPRTGTTQSRSFRILAQITGTDRMKEPETEAAKKTKESQTENGDLSIPADLPNGTGAEEPSINLNKTSVATQTLGMPPVSESPSTPLPPARPEEPAAAVSPVAISSPVSAPSPRLPEHLVSTDPGRETTAERAAPGADGESPPSAKRSVATQAPEPSLPAAAAPQPPPEATRQEPPEPHSDSLEVTQPVAFTAASVRNMPASQENTDARPAPANSTSAAAVKPAGPQSAAKYSGWQPPNRAAPASGWTSNSIKPPGTAAPSEKLAPAPPPAEPDTLVQRAEHIPAGKRTPMCAHCNQVIRGPFLVALGKSWHPEEFNCAHCKASMAYIGFVEEKGALYCEGCYEKFFAPECSRCQRKILGEVINALKQTWHVSCFVCVACHNPIRNNVFHLEDGDPYCETDYYALFGTMCHGCEFPIEAGDRFLEALGHTWHDTCFVCSVCSDSLEGQTFFSKKDKPLCKKHAHSVNI